jgi:hypothetical protein
MGDTTCDQASVVVGDCYGLYLIRADEVTAYLQGQSVVLAACGIVVVLRLLLLIAWG